MLSTGWLLPAQPWETSPHISQVPFPSPHQSVLSLRGIQGPP